MSKRIAPSIGLTVIFVSAALSAIPMTAADSQRLAQLEAKFAGAAEPPVAPGEENDKLDLDILRAEKAKSERTVELPAIVTAVWSPTCVNLQVITDCTNSHVNGEPIVWKTSVSFDEGGRVGSWHFATQDG